MFHSHRRQLWFEQQKNKWIKYKILWLRRQNHWNGIKYLWVLSCVQIYVKGAFLYYFFRFFVRLVDDFLTFVEEQKNDKMRGGGRSLISLMRNRRRISIHETPGSILRASAPACLHERSSVASSPWAHFKKTNQHKHSHTLTQLDRLTSYHTEKLRIW